MDSTDLGQLSDRLRAGDPNAIADVWRYFGDELRRRARTRLRQYGITHETDSMDICNAVMVDLLRQGEVKLERPEEVMHYVLRAIDNQVRDTFRHLSRVRRDFRRIDHHPVEQHQVYQDALTPSKVVFRREIMQQVEQFLSADDRPMVQWIIEGYGWQEIGERLKIEADTARMRFRRALEQVRKQISVADT